MKIKKPHLRKGFYAVSEITMCKKCEILKQHVKIKLTGKKVYYLNIKWFYPREEFPQFVLKFFFFRLFMDLFKLKMYIF